MRTEIECRLLECNVNEIIDNLEKIMQNLLVIGYK